MLDQRSKDLRKQIIRTLAAGGRGHVGPSFSLVEILRVLYDDVLRFDPERPDWPDRDRLILSKGHGCLALYVMLADKGFIDEKELWQFCREVALLGGHPEHHIPGVEASTGSLGHGLSLGIGTALTQRMHGGTGRTFVIAGDGEINEGSIWEAALCAGKHHLSNLTVIVDYNKRQSYGPTDEVQPLEPLLAKWRAFGFLARSVDGHDVEAVRRVFTHGPRYSQTKPRAIIAHTVKGKGIPEIEHHPFWHHKDVFTADDAERLTAALDA